jgi:succinyl-CoA synthetase alpha subunit
MAIWLTKDSKVVVQGMTGSEGSKHTRRMLASGTQVVGGVNPRKAGSSVDFDGTSLPVFATVGEAMKETSADVSVVFVPPAFTKDGRGDRGGRRADPALRRHHRGHPGARHRSLLPVRRERRQHPDRRTQLPRPDQPRQGQRRHHPGRHHQGRPDRAGQMYELRDIGFSTCVGIGGDPVIGTTHIDCLEAFEADPETDAIVMIGEIGGDAEERAAAYIKEKVTKPVVGYVAGFTAPEGKTMGHAGAIVSGSSGTAQAKKEALEAVGVKVGKTPSETARLMREIMTSR